MKTPGVARCVTVWALLSLLTGGLAALLLPVAAASAGAGDFEALLVRVMAAVGLACLARIWLVGSLAVAEALRTAPRATLALGRDGVVRRWVLLACGAAAMTGLAVPAHAASVPEEGPRHPDGPVVLLQGLPLPNRAPGAAPRETVTPQSPPATTVSDPGSRDEVVVAPGDSLWSIAAASLPETASAVEVDGRWRALWELNREVVGPDPDLIHPTQRLVLPPAADREDRP